MSSTAVIIHLLGAAALLVLGLAILRKGMDQAFGSRMRIFLGVGTSNRGKAFGVGFLTTLVLQSSTATAIMTSSFVEQGLILLPMSLAVMLGADMGTSIVSQLVSLKITILSPTFILLGVALPKFLKNRRGEGLGRSFVGLGLMLLALKLMGEATDPIRESTIIQTLFGMLGDVPFAAVVASGLMAAATASSLAVVLFVLSLYQAGAIDPLLAIYFVAGANLGGALPPFFVVGHNHAARQVIAGNLTMRLIGTLLVTWIVPLFPDEIRSFASAWG
ncbi:MAG: Na/Pi symporter, partial [Methylobacteriaceae bacterium]|nr:Na/Pi symporter [Methylobacteriaceae bacterium]